MQTASWPLLGVVTWSLASAEENEMLEAVEFEFGPGWGGSCGYRMYTYLVHIYIYRDNDI